MMRVSLLQVFLGDPEFKEPYPPPSNGQEQGDSPAVVGTTPLLYHQNNFKVSLSISSQTVKL